MALSFASIFLPIVLVFIPFSLSVTWRRRHAQPFLAPLTGPALWCGFSPLSSPPPSPLPLELLLDVGVGEVEVEGGRPKPVVAQDLLHGGQADALPQGGRDSTVPAKVLAPGHPSNRLSGKEWAELRHFLPTFGVLELRLGVVGVRP